MRPSSVPATLDARIRAARLEGELGQADRAGYAQSEQGEARGCLDEAPFAAGRAQTGRDLEPRVRFHVSVSYTTSGVREMEWTGHLRYDVGRNERETLCGVLAGYERDIY